MAWSKEPVCKVVTITETGSPVWVPIATGWEKEETTTTAPPAETTTSIYTEHWDDWTSTVPEALTVTTFIPIAAESTTTTAAVAPVETGSWGNATISSDSVVIPSSTSAAPSSTSSVAPAVATCPADNGATIAGGGSCGCEFAVHCGVQGGVSAAAKFWEQTSGQIVDTLSECLALCDSNDKCEAALWVDDSTSSDYHHCWQTSGLGQPIGTGIAQISYKGTCTGTCASSYGAAAS
ncbi:hypothetical protein A1O1_02457 [Capronia coronata CBS 617.96]|uniref:Uncharacterized protein n=1 Tax=Capronia coronata CBS 617.96 TaxID=1182541 RepID=W9ZHV0_9EURO|nr:uncharacterized protein A1O1_02457 [Capronia coronata CBS 617.96]EXJ94064.1 hypothetical protein A1O1_02457 [Capronia coronata CBS 617.96]